MTFCVTSVDPNHSTGTRESNVRVAFILRSEWVRWMGVLWEWQVRSCSDFGHHASCHMIEALLPRGQRRLSPGWRRFTANQWEDLKEDTSAGGETHCIDQKGTYSPQIQQERCVRSWESCVFCCSIVRLFKTGITISFLFLNFLPQLTSATS